MISDAIAFYDLLTRKINEHKIISALFDYDCKKIYGDDKIEIEKHPIDDKVWFYSVKDIEDYIFIRIPTNAGCVIESLGTQSESENADSKYFRYIAVPDGHIYGGTRPNVKVSFMVVGYKPKDLLNTSEKK